MSNVISGKIIEQIPEIPDELYEIMKLIFILNPTERPHFSKLFQLLTDYHNKTIEKDSKGVSFAETVEFYIKLKSKVPEL